MSRKRCVETITKMRFHHLHVRVWTNCEQPDRSFAAFFGPDERVVEVVDQAVSDTKFYSEENCALERLRDELEKLGHVAAYEIVDAEGNGVVVHPDSK